MSPSRKQRFERALRLSRQWRHTKQRARERDSRGEPVGFESAKRPDGTASPTIGCGQRESTCLSDTWERGPPDNGFVWAGWHHTTLSETTELAVHRSNKYDVFDILQCHCHLAGISVTPCVCRVLRDIRWCRLRWSPPRTVLDKGAIAIISEARFTWK